MSTHEPIVKVTPLINRISAMPDYNVERCDNCFKDLANPVTRLMVIPKNKNYFLKLLVLDFKSPSDLYLVKDRLCRDQLAKCLFIFNELSLTEATNLYSEGAFGIFHRDSHFEDLQISINWFYSQQVQANLFKLLFLKELSLTKIENIILDALLLEADTGLTRQILVDMCWQGVSVHHKTLDVHLFHLRKKLESKNVLIDFNKNRWAIKVVAPPPSSIGKIEEDPCL